MGSGVPQEPGRPCRLRAVNRHEGPSVDSKPLACGSSARLPTGANERAHRAVPPSEGNEVRRDGRQGVGTPRTTVEAGELTRRDPVEGRRRRIADRLRGTMPDIPRSETISTRQQTIATRAQQAPEMSFTSLNHYIDLAWLYEAYRRTRKDGAPGVDGQTAAAYAEHLEENLQDLLDRAKSGRYRAPAVKRAYVPKTGTGSATRPIGIPTFEDKRPDGRCRSLADS